MADPFIGQLLCVGFNFAPRDWAFCNGQLLGINENQALFSLLGTTYGGDGQSTFGLPNLQGRAAVGMGTGPGLSNIALGQIAGTQQITLQASNLPTHNHPIAASNSATSKAPAGLVSATTSDSAAGAEVSAYGVADGNTLAAGACGSVGGGQPVDIMNPYLGLNWIICLSGIYPSQN